MRRWLVGVLLFFPWVQTHAVDYTFYLSQRPLHFVNGHELAEDPFGNQFRVRTYADDEQRLSAVADSMVMDLIGAPNATLFPIWVQKNAMGQLSLSSTPEVDGTWVPATLQPAIFTGDFPSRLSTQKAAQVVTIAFTSYALGINPTSAPLNYSRSGHFVLAPARKNFNYGPTYLPEVLDLLPNAIWDTASTNEMDFFTHLNVTLTRLEEISPETWEMVFQELWQGLQGSSRKGAFLSRVRNMRGELTSFFDSGFDGSHWNHGLQRPMRLPPPHLLLPPHEPPKDPASVDILWAKYFSPGRSEIPSAELGKLREAAASEDKRLCEVGPHLDYHRRGDTLAQVALNKQNGEILIVVSPNDAEGEEIVRIAEIARANVLKLDPENYPHGSHLTDNLKLEILEYAAKVRAKRIFVVELPGKEESGFIIVDHHEYAGESRYKPYSSLEQVAEILGVKLSPISRIIAVADAQFMWGKLDLGVSKEAIIPSSRARLPLPGSATWYPLKVGRLLIVREPLTNAQRAQIIVNNYPVPVNILSIDGNGFHFEGEARLVTILSGYVSPRTAEGRNFYAGGSRSRLGYLRFEVKASVRDEVLDQFVDYLEAEEGLVLPPKSSPNVCHKVNNQA